MPFISLEGLDGAGKSTQIALIKSYLENIGKEFEYLHFPRFDAPIYGEMIARFLRGELGALENVDPYVVAMLYAGDRKDASEMVNKWIAEGKFVLIDRYVYSNIAYQCAKLESVKASELKQWIINLEYEYNKIPKPELSIFLDVPFAFTQKKLTSTREGDDRDYLKGADDIHESSLELQRKVRQVYLDSAAQDSDFHVIDCSNGLESMDTPENIFSRIIKLIEPIL
ncbi:MAG: dTMP kinase [Rikenellaceae bacterium]